MPPQTICYQLKKEKSKNNSSSPVTNLRMMLWKPISHCNVCCNMLFLPVIFLFHWLSSSVVCVENTYLQNPIIGSTTDRSCQRPPGCELHCPFGYQIDPLGICLCTCHDAPCLSKICAPNEYCRYNSDGAAVCVPQIGGNRVAVRPSECPRLFDGACIHQCNSDSECGSNMLKCCSNGCGRECVVALSPQAIVNSLSIHPLQITGYSNRIGKCPLKNSIKNQKCAIECIYDDECPSVEKCCDNDCGRVCTPPDKATDCIHLASAVNRLPEKTLIRGYVPKCTVNGQFENIQCDDSFCWCVDEKGTEITGTKIIRTIGLPDCLQRRECKAKLCLKACPFGIKTDQEGCPLDNCDCRDLCEEVKCINDIDICQIVEPDCEKPPCLPVPRCLLNPCPNGSPMTLSNGVTALCTDTNQCSPNYWCHQIGFNGFGFCCALPESVVHSGNCVPILSRSSKSSKSECHIDSDCSKQAKCCFDGCGLKCMLNRACTKVQQIAECPEVQQYHDLKKCTVECKVDQDCPGIKKCCTYNCSALCLFPTKVTACLHELITHEIFGYDRAPKCNDEGNYEQIQCHDDFCYCVDTVNGNEIPATRTALHTELACNERRIDCEPFRCSKICAYGFKLTDEGCLSCECYNPCKKILCSQGYICVMASVKCLENVYCPDQPRCVPDVCSTDDSSVVPPILCKSKQNCPDDYWCNNIGIQSKGLCCPLPSKQLRIDAKCKSVEPFIEHKKPCDTHCRTDDECAIGTKCCYDGCGTTCVQISDGNYKDIQCNTLYCWCVSKTGVELEGTKVLNEETPNCRARRLCTPRHCPMKKNCVYGFETDRNGCVTCDCFNPCKDIICPNKSEICVPQLTECIESPCRAVPNCVASTCPEGLPIIDENTFEPFPCNSNKQCTLLSVSSFCHTSGYCCWNSEKTPDRTKVSELGECPHLSNNPASCLNNQTDECVQDVDCDTVQKCCSNGCKKLCMYPEITTACIHLLGASEAFEPGSFVPQCDTTGNFNRIQKLGAIFWCVDESGRELHGTRTSHPYLNCDLPRSCPLLNCQLDCSLGYEKNENGCDLCRCHDPCKNVRCPLTHVCRLIDVKCLLGSCDPITKCILNVCPKGEPLTLPNMRKVVLCNTKENRHCPLGYFCHEIGIPLPFASSYCCAGNEVSLALCPITFEFRPTVSKKCKIRCHTHNDCLSGKCCFNGCGTSCMNLQAEEMDQNIVFNFSKGVFSKGTGRIHILVYTYLKSHREFEKLQDCSMDVISDQSCKIDCLKDSDCPVFQKCCIKGCSSLCAFPHATTACIHKLASYTNKNNEISFNGPRIDCNEGGTFKKIQCDQQIRQCWCVNTETGEEMLGTRVIAAIAKPNCQAPIFCSTVCDQMKCEHGLRLDINGCPLNNFCECKNPCEEIKCARKEDICVLMPVICITSPCPSVPQCKSNPCPKHSEVLRDKNNNVFSCVQNEDCSTGLCRLLPNEQRHGICCTSGIWFHIKTVTSSTGRIDGIILKQKLGECPRIAPSKSLYTENCSMECSNDSACPEVQLCCDYGCSKICVIPEVATNCILLHASITKLIHSGAIVSLRIPWCNKHTGMFETVQCNDLNDCWCVNAVTGATIHGSRSSKMKSLDSSLTFSYDVCSNKKSCSISCNDAICPLGFEMDANNCPKDIHCRCRNLCDAIRCSDNKVCMLRRKNCSESTCIPVPSCEPNPCSDISKPALDETTYIHLSCSENHTEMCPPAYYCAGYDTSRQGVCCPRIKTKEARSDMVGCPHGNPFSNKADGWPLNCSQSGNDCPSTHYCFTASDQSFGVCCVSKRYVCHLPLDAGPCTVNLKRYYYNYTNNTCVSFNYGGCSGNSNNFINRKHCEKFCLDINVGLNGFFTDTGKVIETYQLGFSLTGPLFRKKHQQDINEAFREYMKKKFDIGDDELRDIVISDDNMVQFVLRSEDAKLKAADISDVVSEGSFRFTYNGDIYRAEPHSWTSHRIAEKKALCGKIFLCVLVGVSIILAVIVLTSLLCACRFLYKKRENKSSLGGITSSQYAARTDYATPAAISSTPKSGTSSEHFEQLMESENRHHYRQTVNKERDLYEVHKALQTPGGLQRYRTTVYY
ncbi:Thyroglobulin type-1 repeat family protein [Acanthocheilonema viteae]